MSARSLPRLLLLAAAVVPACGNRASDSTTAPPAFPTGAPVTAGSSVQPGADVTVTGRVLDEVSGEGLQGSYVIVLAPGVSFGEWERSADEGVEALMAGAAVTDSVGRYEVPDLARGADFTVVIAARGHAPAVFESGLTVRVDDPPVTRLADVRLERR